MQDKSTDPRRKILILATSYLPLIGGAELAIKDLTDRLSEFSFDLVTARTTSGLLRTERIGNVNVFRAGNAPSALNFFLPKVFLPVAIFFKARTLLASKKYNLIYILQASQAGGAGWLLRKFGRINQPVVINLQEGKDFSRQAFLVRYFRRWIIKSADYYVVISTYLKDFLIAQGVIERHIFLIPNGVDGNYESRNTNQELREKLGISLQDKVIITVSRLVEKNGIADLIKAMVFIKGNYFEPVKLLIVGDAEPRLSLESDLKNLTRELRLGSEVIFAGAVRHESIFSYLSLANVFVRPSYSEGLGTAFLEAMAVGVPVIGTRVGGIVDFIEEGQTGLYCAIGDSQDIGRKVIHVLSDKELHDKLARQGQKLIQQKYDWDIVVKKFLNFYETVTK